MPCEAKRLLRLRFRGYGDDVAAAAQARWESDAVPAEALRIELPEGPLDARLWLGAFPFVALAEATVSAAHGPEVQLGGLPLPASDEPIHRALGALSRIDPADTSLIIDGIRGELDPATWRAGLGLGDSALVDRVALALYRALALRFEVVGRIASSAQREALVARRFAPDAGGEIGALGVLRDAMGNPTLSMATLRSWYRAGAESSLRILEVDAHVAPVLTLEAVAAIARGLRLDGERPTRPDDAGADLGFAEPLFMLLSRDVSAGGVRGSDGHVRVRQLADLAQGDVLDPDEAARVAEHLLACRDGRCNALVRAEVIGREACRLSLSMPTTEPPHGAGHGLNAGPASPHMIKCRDVLWETFNNMAHAEGRSVDDLVEEAMDGYRQLRARVRSESGLPRAAPSEPRGTGLHLGGSRPSRPPSAAPPAERPPIPRPTDSEEATMPRGTQSDLEEEELTTPRT